MPDLETGKQIIRELLEWLELNRTHPDLQGTPRRIASMYLEMFDGMYQDGGPDITVFENTEEYEDMIIVKDIDFSSMCSHHFLPFTGQAHIGYIPADKYVGLSKMARVLDYFAKRPQIQERLTTQVADYLYDELDPKGLIVVVEAAHLCMTVRGVKKHNSETVTSAIRGHIDKDEFMRLVELE